MGDGVRHTSLDPAELQEVRLLARTFVEKHLIPLENEAPNTEFLPAEILKPLQEHARAFGLWLVDVPEALGGMGLGLLPTVVIREEFARTKTVSFRGNQVLGPYMPAVLFEEASEYHEREFLRPTIEFGKRWCFALTEPDAGTDPAAITTTARRDGDSFLLNGTKRFISGGAEADFALVFCRTDDGTGRSAGATAFIVDLSAPGFAVGQRWTTMMGDAPVDLTFDEVRVPEANILGREGDGFRLGQRSLTAERMSGQAAWSIGVAQRALELAHEYAGVRTTFGRLLSERQAVQFMLADSATDIRLARLLVYDAATRHDRGEDVREASYMAKIFCTEMASRVVDRAIQILGGIGLTDELPLEYFYRQIRSLRITEGASEVLRWSLAKNILKKGLGPATLKDWPA